MFFLEMFFTKELRIFFLLEIWLQFFGNFFLMDFFFKINFKIAGTKTLCTDYVHTRRLQSFFTLFFQFSQLCGLAIIHKRNAPHLATGQISKVNILKIAA